MLTLHKLPAPFWNLPFVNVQGPLNKSQKRPQPSGHFSLTSLEMSHIITPLRRSRVTGDFQAKSNFFCGFHILCTPATQWGLICLGHSSPDNYRAPAVCTVGGGAHRAHLHPVKRMTPELVHRAELKQAGRDRGFATGLGCLDQEERMARLLTARLLPSQGRKRLKDDVIWCRHLPSPLNVMAQSCVSQW